MKSKTKIVFTALLLLWFVGLVFFGSKVAMAYQDRKSDQHTIKNLQQAMDSYRSENKRYPGQTDHLSNDIDLQSDYFFMVHLSPLPNDHPKAAFFAGKPAVKDSQTGKWQNGLQLDTPETGGLFDNRGNPFRIRLDASGDGKVYSPINNQMLNEPFLIWSAGKDGNFETWADNAVSWK